MPENSALRQLFERHAGALVLFARQWCSDHAQAEDAVQDAFVKYWRTGHPPGDAVGFLYSAVRSCALDQRRGNQRRERREERASRVDSADWFNAGPEQREFAAIVQLNLERLPQEQSEVVLLKVWAELTFAQIGQVLEISSNTAASRYRYGIDALRKLLKPEVIP